MERVTFLVPRSGERVSCVLNPESLVVRRAAGVRARVGRDAPLTGDAQTDAPLLFTGGGTTTLEMDLLFDVGLAGSSPAADDVRQLTGPLWKLAENATDGRPADRGPPPVAYFVWGKSWSVPGVVTAVSERFDQFTPGGVPQRSWLRLRFRRVDEGPAAATGGGTRVRPAVDPAALVPDPTVPDMGVQELGGEGAPDLADPPLAAERLDLLAERWYGDPAYWRLLARANDVDDPLALASGRALRVPAAGGSTRPAGGTA